MIALVGATGRTGAALARALTQWFAPMLLSLHAGAFEDRLDRRTVIIVANAVTLALSCAVLAMKIRFHRRPAAT